MLIACFFKKEHVNKKQGATPCGSQGSGLKQEKTGFWSSLRHFGTGKTEVSFGS